MEFDLKAFTDKIRQNLYDNFPYGPLTNPSGSLRHPNRKGHVRDYAFMKLPLLYAENTISFDIGSPNAEKDYPHYHILEDAEVIRIRGKGTKKSKGSQDAISDLKARDYGRVEWNGKTYTQEYKRNVRGSRSRQGKARQVFVDSNGVVYRINETASYYYNKHFKYIERTLDATLPFIAQEMGLKMKRVKDTELADEYNLQQQLDRQGQLPNSKGNYLSYENSAIIESIGSFLED